MLRPSARGPCTTMRFPPVKSGERQSRCMVFRTRDLLVRRRTRTVNARRGHLAEFGIIAPQGIADVERSGLPEAVRDMANRMARMARAPMTKKESRRDPVTAAARVAVA